MFDLTEDPGETNNIQDKHPAKVKELVEELAHIINNGRSTPGPKLENHGAIRFRLELTERFPVLE